MNNFYYIIISVLGWGSGGLFTKLASTHNLTPVHQLCVSTAVYIGILPLYFMGFKPSGVPSAMSVAWGVISALCTSVGTIFYLLAMKNGKAGEIVSLTATYPIVTCILAYFFLNESFSFHKIFGISLILIGTFLVYTVK